MTVFKAGLAQMGLPWGRLLSLLRTSLTWGRMGPVSNPLTSRRAALSTLRLADRWRQHWPDIVIITILALLPALFFWRLIAPNPADRMSIPAGDFTGQYYPLRAYAARELAAGRLPLWNPSPYGGQPALADIQSGALYPPQIVEALLLGWLGLGFPVWALELQVIAHFAWAAVGAYLLGRRLAARAGARPRAARLAGTVTSLVFTYSGYLTGFPVQQLTILEVSAWLPWVVLGMEGLVEIGSRKLDVSTTTVLLPCHSERNEVERRIPKIIALQQPTALGILRRSAPQNDMYGCSIRNWILAGLALGLSLLPGHPQTSLYVLYTAVAFYLFRVIAQSAASRQRAAVSGQPSAISDQPSAVGDQPSAISNLQPPTSSLQLPTSNLQPPISNLCSHPPSGCRRRRSSAGRRPTPAHARTVTPLVSQRRAAV